MEWFTPICRDKVVDLVQRLPRHLWSNAYSFIFAILSRASRGDGEYDGHALQRGQFVYGQLRLGEECGLGRQQVRTLSDHFERRGELTIESTHRGSIATICNFDIYVIDGQESNQPSNQQVTNRQPAGNHILNPKVEVPDTSVSGAPDGAPDPGNKGGKRDDYIDECTRLWQKIPTNGKVPYSLFSKWRTDFGPDEPIAVMEQIVQSGKKLTRSAQAYVSKALINRRDERERNAIETEPWTPPEGFEYLMEEPS